MADASAIARRVEQGKTYLGIELGSTRIKAVLIGESFGTVASGEHGWENRLENGFWTYSMDDVWKGVADSFSRLSEDAYAKYGVRVEALGGMGVSAMMHGYLPFDADGNQLAAFRTWRNTTTERASQMLTKNFSFNIPQRWSIAHLYQAILNGETHVKDVDFLTTLAGYVHWRLTGEKVLGVGEASGVFPIDSETNSYNLHMTESFDALVSVDSNKLSKNILDILPKVLNAGDNAGYLTETGARLLDPTGALKAGAPLCPPEGDAGTGMVATNSIKTHTGNISAGTSVFAMIVLDNELSEVYTEIDMVTTPAGKPVAMIHCNSCTSDLDAWVKLFGEAAELMGATFDKSALYTALYNEALKGDLDGGGLLSYNYYSGEPITGLDAGRPLFARLPDSSLSLASFMRTALYSSVATLKIGMDILTEKERIRLDKITGHGGLFKTKGVGQTIMADALNVPVSVMETAGEGGAWGIALLACFAQMKEKDETLDEFLAEKVFAGSEGATVTPDVNGVNGFKSFMKRYVKGLEIERAAVSAL